MSQRIRTVVKTVKAQATSDGAGVRLSRSLGSPALDTLDSFLLLNEFKSDERSDYIAGFPDHPHRGFETVTYMLAGFMQHRDHKGNEGNLGPRSIQWMTAGRGIIHSEMPKQENGLLWNFQLWVNLPGKDKMTPPRYQDLRPEDVPKIERAYGRRFAYSLVSARALAEPSAALLPIPFTLTLLFPYTRLLNGRSRQAIRRAVISSKAKAVSAARRDTRAKQSKNTP